MAAHDNDAIMSTLFITRREAQRTRQTQAHIEASREWQVLGVADSQFRARAALPQIDPDALLIDLRLEDGTALSLVRELRQRRAERPKVMVLAADATDPLLFITMQAGADAYLLEADLAVAANALKRMLAGEAAMAAPLAVETLRFFGEPLAAPNIGNAVNDRALDWQGNGGNPMKLSAGERHLLQSVAAGATSTALAARMALSVEAISRRIGNIYRKLSWEIGRAHV